MNKYTHIKSNSVCFVTRPKQSGFSLIEIMVAALILSIGILGVVGLQVVGLKGTQQSYMKQQAMGVVQNLTERMRSNKQGVFNGNYLVVDSDTFSCTTAVPNCSTADCTSENLATADLHNLICGYKIGGASRTGGLRHIATGDISAFSEGELSVACPNADGCSTGDVRIEVNWSERAIGKEEITIKDSLVINTRISP